METNQTTPINHDLIESSGEKLKWIGYLIFMNILLSGFFYYLISEKAEDINLLNIFQNPSEFKNILEEIKSLTKIWGILSLILTIVKGVLFIEAGKKFIDSVIFSSVKNSSSGRSELSDTNFRQLMNGETIKIVVKNKNIIGSNVYINDELVPDGSYVYKFDFFKEKMLTHKLIVKDGKVIEKCYLEQNENFIFEKKGKDLPVKGDKVFLLDNQVPENGKVKYSKFKSFYIENGRIVK